MECSEALVVGRVHVGAPSEEQINTRRIALVCSPHERGMALGIWNINGYVLVEQQDDLVHIAVERGAVQEIEALVVGEERVGAVVEQEVDNVVVATLRSPEDGLDGGAVGRGLADAGVDCSKLAVGHSQAIWCAHM